MPQRSPRMTKKKRHHAVVDALDTQTVIASELPQNDEPPPVAASVEGEGSALSVPLLSALSRCWFARTWRYLDMSSPDEIVMFSHNPHEVTVRIAGGTEYSIPKERL